MFDGLSVFLGIAWAARVLPGEAMGFWRGAAVIERAATSKGDDDAEAA
jgi:hypothetical protein